MLAAKNPGSGCVDLVRRMETKRARCVPSLDKVGATGALGKLGEPKDATRAELGVLQGGLVPTTGHIVYKEGLAEYDRRRMDNQRNCNGEQ